MRSIVLVLISLILNSDGYPQVVKRNSAVTLVVVKQERFNNKSHVPHANRRIVLKLTSHTNRPIVVHGFRSSFGFFPVGHLVRFDPRISAWVNPEGEITNPNFSEIADEAPDSYVLRPGKSLVFLSLGEQQYVGSRFKRVIYLSMRNGEEPQAVTSEEFILR